MKKKGFTLVELLAVIAILAILVIIALPNVLGMFNSAKRNTFVTEVETIFKQAQTNFINDALQGAGERWYCDTGAANADGKTKGNCKKLDLTTTKHYAVYMNSAGKVKYLAVNDNSYVYGIENATADGVVITDIDGKYVFDKSKATGWALWSKKTSGVTGTNLTNQKCVNTENGQNATTHAYE